MPLDVVAVAFVVLGYLSAISLQREFNCHHVDQQMPLDVSLLDDFETNRDRLDIEKAAARIDIPWLVVHGGDDMTVRPDDAHRLVAASEHASLVLIEGAGHTFNAVHPFEAPVPALEHALDASFRYVKGRLPLD